MVIAQKGPRRRILRTGVAAGRLARWLLPVLALAACGSSPGPGAADAAGEGSGNAGRGGDASADAPGTAGTSGDDGQVIATDGDSEAVDEDASSDLAESGGPAFRVSESLPQTLSGV
jgi:hypothetical protein